MFNLNGIYGYTLFGRILATIVKVAGYGILIAALFAVVYSYFYQGIVNDNWEKWWFLLLVILAIFVAFQIFSFALLLVWRAFELIAWLGASEQHRWEIVEQRQMKRIEKQELALARQRCDSLVQEIQARRSVYERPYNGNNGSTPIKYNLKDKRNAVSSLPEAGNGGNDIDEEDTKLFEQEFQLPI